MVYTFWLKTVLYFEMQNDESEIKLDFKSQIKRMGMNQFRAVYILFAAYKIASVPPHSVHQSHVPLFINVANIMMQL